MELMSICKFKAGGQQTMASGLFSYFKPRVFFTFLVSY